MQCSFCSHVFSDDEARHACGACAAFGGCRKVKCPRCGYETPEIPSLLKLLTKWGKRKVGSSR